MNRLRLLLVLCLSASLRAEPKPGDADFPNPRPSPRHDQNVALARSGTHDLLVIGDSISHTLQNYGGKYVTLTKVWDRHYGHRRALNLATSGYRTEDILWNLQNGELDMAISPKLAVLLIGTNNLDDRRFQKAHTPEQVLEGTRAIVNTVRRRHPTTKVLILRIFPRGGDDEEGTSRPIFKTSPASLAACRRAGELTASLADGENVFWLDINHVFLRPDGRINVDLMPDLLHPNHAGAQAWLQAIEPTVARLLGDTPILDEQPNNAVVPVPKLENDGYDWYARHEDLLRNRRPADVVMIGDSITHFWEERNGPQIWKDLFRDRTVRNLGYGWDRTQNVLWRLDQGELDRVHPKRVVVLIGTNNITGTKNCRANTAPEIVEGVRAVLQRVRAKAPQAGITLMALLPRWGAADPRRALIAEVNRGLELLATEAKADFLDLGPRFVDEKGEIPRSLMGDGTHPTAAGYAIWAEALRPAVEAAGAPAASSATP
jgi:lysophospholipase L1-like esterase